MPELVRLMAVASSLFAMWFVSAGLLIHGAVWGLYGIESGWNWFYPDVMRFAQEMKIQGSWIPGGEWVPEPSWRMTVEWTLWVAIAMSAFPVLSYCVLPLRSQVKSVLGPHAWAMTSRVRTDEILGEVFASVKQEAGVKKPVSLYLVKTGGPLAFAMGAPFRGTVVLSQGLVNGLAPDEVRWVMAHELAHIRYRDMMLGALWISSMRGLNIFERIKVAVINLVLRILTMFRAPVLLMRLLVSAIKATLSVIGLGRWIALKMFTLVDRWVSRHTEFRADRFAADTQGGEPGARALHRLGGDAEPLFNGLFATHPKISARIERLMS